MSVLPAVPAPPPHFLSLLSNLSDAALLADNFGELDEFDQQFALEYQRNILLILEDVSQRYQ